MILGAGDIPGVSNLPATMVIDADNRVSISSFWVPDTEELKALNEGGGVMVTIMGSAHPPIMVEVSPVEGFKTNG